MRTHLLALVVLVGCTQSQKSTPLADLSSAYGDVRLEVVARGQVNIELHVASQNGDCPRLADDAAATFDGMPMQVARGGTAQQSDACYPIAFWFDNFPDAQVQGFERTTSASQLVVLDKSAEWRVDTGAMFTSDFVNDAANAKITWSNVTTITSAELYPPAPVTISGNTISYPKGSQITFVDAISHPDATRCAGPAQCTVFLEGQHDWTINP